MNQAADYCMAQVRQADKDRFLATLFAPDEARPHLFALYAFNLEIAHIRDAVSEPQMGLIRQQWWLDTLDAMAEGDVPAHPVAQALAAAIAEAQLPVEPLRRLVLAREFDLHADPMPSLDALETYLGETSSALIQMAALILAGEAAGQASDAAGLAGVAFGLSQLLRGSKGSRSRLPPDMDASAAASHALRRLGEARAAADAIPQAALPAFLPVSLTELYLRRSEPSQFRRQATLWFAARRNRF